MTNRIPKKKFVCVFDESLGLVTGPDEKGNRNNESNPVIIVDCHWMMESGVVPDMVLVTSSNDILLSKSSLITIVTHYLIIKLRSLSIIKISLGTDMIATNYST